jgi:hypothetical protein
MGTATSRAAVRCELQRTLAQEFALATRLYAEAVVALTELRGSATNSQELHLNCQTARRRAEEARVAFEDHLRNHQC